VHCWCGWCLGMINEILAPFCFFVMWFRVLDVCVWVNRVIFPKKKSLHCLQ
jgi:hypothetical protein